MKELNKIYHGDCLEVMQGIDDKSIDMILCDLPYGITACKWDTVIPLEPLWALYKRIIKDSGAVVLFGVEPFSSKLRLSNVDMYKYDWIWLKNRATGFFSANKMPLRSHENILIFSKKTIKYNPQFVAGKAYTHKATIQNENGVYAGSKKTATYNEGTRYPTTIIYDISCIMLGSKHPTQKPVELFKYLIKTYTNTGDLILDNCIGSGTTAIAAITLDRNWIGIEQELGYVEMANKRIKDTPIQRELEMAI